MRKTVIFGGTFNPIHNGHLIALNSLLDSGFFDRVLLMPSGVPPYKPDEHHSLEHRINMAKIAASGLEDVELNLYEAKRAGKSYTYQTLRDLSRLFPEDKLFWCIGFDHLFTIEKWYQSQNLLEQYGLAILNRGGYDPQAAHLKIKTIEESYHTDMRVIDMPQIEISSTAIRQRIKTGKSVYGYLPEEIYAYIMKNGLYRE